VLKRVDDKGTSSVRVFESDDHLFKVGHGDVDDVQVMVAGNITNFPKRETQSDTMVCNQATTTDRTKVTVTGQIMTGGEASADFTMTLEAQDEHKMAFNAKTKANASAKDATDSNNYFSMSYYSPVDEEIYGMGLQYSEWNFKDKSVPLISAEAGVGRGIEPITSVQNRFMGG